MQLNIDQAYEITGLFQEAIDLQEFLLNLDDPDFYAEDDYEVKLPVSVLRLAMAQGTFRDLALLRVAQVENDLLSLGVELVH